MYEYFATKIRIKKLFFQKINLELLILLGVSKEFEKVLIDNKS